MKNELLNSLLHISINGPSAKSKEAHQLLERVCNAYVNEKHKKTPQICSLSNVETFAQNCEKETSCLNFVQLDFHQASFMISNFVEEEFSEENDNASDVGVAWIVLL